MKERNRIFDRRDTIPYCFPPADYKGDGAIVLHNRLKEEDLPNLRIVQEWYWDNHKNELLVRLHSIAPMQNCTNEAGDFLYREAIFYRKNDD
ncbi:MAG: hypothetical protein JNL70_20075 [Saprospiraceae bacterium]|nr:hypothetical protein [Saprospiraceae bacterium]